MTNKEINKLISEINDKATEKGSFVTANFGDEWEEYARTHEAHDRNTLAHIAWVQGRRAILLEMALRKALK